MRDLQRIIFIWRQRYCQIVKYALAYFSGFLFFQTYSPKCPNKAFLVPSLLVFVLDNFLYFGKFEDGDIKYKQWFFRFMGQNTQIRRFWIHFLLLLLSLLLFCSIFDIWISSRMLISNMTLAFLNFSLKISKKAFLMQI